MQAVLVLIVLGVIAVGIVSYAVTLYNSLIIVKNNIPKAWANIDVLLKQRHDEIPKLIKTCESYMQYEKNTLTKIIELRSAAQNAKSVTERAQKEGALSDGLRHLFALAENYPDLKAQNGFQQLQNRISDLENQIADRREFYNDSVNNFNIRIESFPDSLIATRMSLSKQEMFKVSESDKEDIEINIAIPK